MGLNVDSAAIAHPERLRELLEDSFVALVSSKPTRTTKSATTPKKRARTS
jgi:hypothetical protein